MPPFEVKHSFALFKGVHRVKRNFLTHLWDESQYEDEDIWKSSARQHLEAFEHELYSAVQSSARPSFNPLEWTIYSAVFNVWSVSTSLPGKGYCVGLCYFSRPFYVNIFIVWTFITCTRGPHKAITIVIINE